MWHLRVRYSPPSYAVAGIEERSAPSRDGVRPRNALGMLA